MVRLICIPCLAAMLLFAGSCGGGSGGGDGAPQLLGGILRPDPTAYALTQTNDLISAVSGDCTSGFGNIVPTSVDLRKDGTIPPVQNQRWNSCVAWALGYFVMTALEATEDNLDRNPSGELVFRQSVDVASDPEHWFSPDYIYSQRDTQEERDLIAPGAPGCTETDGQLGCMRPENALRILVEQGCGKWTWMCDGNPDSAYRSCAPDDPSLEGLSSRRAFGATRFGADEFKPTCYVRFGVLDEQARVPVAEMRAWLAEERTPIAIVVKMAEGWVGYRGENPATVETSRGLVCRATEPRTVCLDAAGHDLGSQHMMTVIGYDDAFPNARQYPGLAPEKTGSFLVVNQWGTKWGDQGFMWIPYSELAKIWIGAYGILGGVAARPQDDQVAGECVQDVTGRWNNLFEDDDVPQNRDAASPIGAPLEHPRDTTARELAEGGEYISEETVGGVDLADWYYIETTERDTWVDVEARSVADVNMKLTDQHGRLVASAISLPADAPAERLTRLLCEPGVYFLKVYMRGGAEAVYYLSRSIPAAGLQRDDDICGATPITPVCLCAVAAKPGVGSTRVDGVVESEVGGEDRCDWWQVIAPATGTVEIATSGLNLVTSVWRGARPEDATLVGVATSPYPDGFEAHLSVPTAMGQRYFIQVQPARALDDDGGAIVPPETDYTLFVAGATTAPRNLVGGAQPLLFCQVERDNPLHPTLERTDHVQKWQASTTGRVDSGGNKLEYHRFVLPAGTAANVQLTGVAQDASLFVSIVSKRARASTNPGQTELVFFAGLTTDEVLVAVGARDGASDYRLTVDTYFGEDPALDEPDELNPRMLIPNQPHAEMVGGAGLSCDVTREDERDTIDWYRIEELPEDATAATVTITGYCGNPTLRLVDASQADVPTTGLSAIPGIMRKQFQIPRNGPVWVGVVAGDQPTEYTLSIATMATPAGVGGVNTPPHAQPLAIGAIHTDAVGALDARDFFRIEVPTGTGPTSVTLQLSDLTGRLRLSVSDDVGSLCDGNLEACRADNVPVEVFDPVSEAFDLVIPNVMPGAQITVLVEPRGHNEFFPLLPDEISYTLLVTTGN